MKEHILDRIRNIDDLPTLPSVALEVLSLAHQADVTIQGIAECIHRDPPLAAKVLRMANSVFYRRGDRKVETLHHAIIFLGLAEIINITTSLSVFSALKSRKAQEVSVRESFWDHSVATGLIARHIDRKLGMRAMGREFVAGLLHDIGKIILDQYFHKEFITAYDMSIEKDRPMYETELEVCGTNHMEVGFFIAQKWNLPSYLADVILWHHQPSQASSRDMAALISMANFLAKASQLSCGGDRMSFILTDQDAWKVLKERGYDVDALDIERITFEMETIGDQVKSYIDTVMEPTGKEPGNG
ncbi:MAG TPA: HDOD domain-containing protein [Deltaproteobacteria bacterium]|nr:HDOD domain-containing protein [Deltaproteobacteria bacterium]HPR55682.1 HDOD domain-containing protein [Deltaproteobacteria bacterium]